MKTSAITLALARLIDEVRDEEMREDDERHREQDAKREREAESRAERELRALELAACSLRQLAEAVQRISSTGIPR